MVNVWYGIIVTSHLYLEKLSDINLAMMYDEGEITEDYSKWSRKKILKEYIKNLITKEIENDPRAKRIFNESFIISLDSLNEKGLESVLLNNFQNWSSIRLPGTPTYLINKGEHIFIGYELKTLLSNAYIIRPIESVIADQEEDNLREELDTWGFQDFEIKTYVVPQRFTINIAVEGEDKERLP